MFRIIADESALLNLSDQWQALYQTSDPEFPERSFLWAWTAWKTIARPRGHRLHIVAAFADGQLVLVLPLVVQCAWPVRIGRWLGPEFGEYSDALVKPGAEAEEWLAAAWDLVGSRFNLLRIPAVRADAKIWPHVDRVRSRQSTPTSAPYIDCRQWPDWPAYLSARSKSFRQNLQRYNRQLGKAGAPAFVAIDDEFRARATIDWIFDKKIDRFAHTHYGATVFPAKKEFCWRICRDALQRGELIMSELWVADRRIAAQWGLRSGRRLHTQMFAWDQDWKHCGPGHLISVESIRWAMEHGIDEFDLGIGAGEDKRQYTDTAQSVATDNVLAFGPLGGLLGQAVVGARRARRAFGHVAGRKKHTTAKGYV